MKLRRLLIGLLTVLLLSAAVSAAEYSDVSDTHWANEQIVYLQDEITGYPDGTFRPEKTVSHAEFLTLFARIAFPDEWKQAEGDEWWKAAYDVCTAHRLLDDATGSRSEVMPRGEIAALLDRFCSGWGGVHERADAAIQSAINWTEKRMESPEWQPLWPDAAEYGNSVLICANQGLLTGYPDGSFKPNKGVTRAEAAAILARLKAQLALREKGCEYVCTVGAYWLMQYSLSGSVGLGLYEPLTGKTVQTVGLWKAAQGVNGYVAFDRLLSGSDGIYVWGRAGLYKRSGNTLEQIVAEPVLDFCRYGDNTELGRYQADTGICLRGCIFPLRLESDEAGKPGTERRALHPCRTRREQPNAESDRYLCGIRNAICCRLVLHGHCGSARCALRGQRR